MGCLDPENENQPFEETGKLKPIVFDKDIFSKNDKITHVSSSSSVGYAISKEGKGYAWGFGENLQLTTGEEDDENVPIELQGGRLEGRTIFGAL